MIKPVTWHRLPGMMPAGRLAGVAGYMRSGVDIGLLYHKALKKPDYFEDFKWRRLLLPKMKINELPAGFGYRVWVAGKTTLMKDFTAI